MTRTAPTLEEIESGRAASKLKDREFWKRNGIVAKAIDIIDTKLETHDFSDESQCIGNTGTLTDERIPRGVKEEIDEIVNHYNSYGYHCHIEISGEYTIFYKLTPQSISKQIIGLR